LAEMHNNKNDGVSSVSKTIDFQKRLLDIFCHELNSMREADSNDHSRLYDQAEFIGSQIIKGER
jgi:hypothetical protein